MNVSADFDLKLDDPVAVDRVRFISKRRDEENEGQQPRADPLRLAGWTWMFPIRALSEPPQLPFLKL